MFTDYWFAPTSSARALASPLRPLALTSSQHSLRGVRSLSTLNEAEGSSHLSPFTYNHSPAPASLNANRSTLNEAEGIIHLRAAHSLIVIRQSTLHTAASQRLIPRNFQDWTIDVEESQFSLGSCSEMPPTNCRYCLKWCCVCNSSSVACQSVNPIQKADSLQPMYIQYLQSVLSPIVGYP